MSFKNFIGETLDEKYQIERELGRGGMGTVYLATHVGTGRSVAVKIIAPEFMERAEFVERFRREARAAGRLRHPNVVNVTDFGFAEASGGRVAYLVMEYLDGCTLGEILEEEKNLPVGWTLDILEQVCSAVHEAHLQGIIHRDLKPDNIWLEPNPSGGYTVKVLDFGIAKLEDHFPGQTEKISGDYPNLAAQIPPARATVAGLSQNETVADKSGTTLVSEAATIVQAPEHNTMFSEAGTLVQTVEAESDDQTVILPSSQTLADGQDSIGTKIITEPIETNQSAGRSSFTGRSFFDAPANKELTRVGAVLGTPLFMSPEQCRGEKLSPRSDIYSLGVIAYRMLGGKTPFEGDFTEVMRSHREVLPPLLVAKKVPKKIGQVIYSALSKNPDERPPTAQAFGAELRAQSEGIGTLLRRALTIYSEHLPKFLSLAILLYSPVALVTILQVSISFLSLGNTISDTTKLVLTILLTVVSTFFGVFCGYMVFGTTTWLVSQILAVPLRPVRLRPALMMTRRKWKTLAGTGMMSATLTVLGYILCFVPGMILSVIWALVAPVVMMENLRGFAALKRSKTLIMRSLGTTIAMIFIMFFVPLLISSLTAFVANATAKSFTQDSEKVSAAQQQAAANPDSNGRPVTRGVVRLQGEDINIRVNESGVKITEGDESKDMSTRIRATVREALTQILLLPISILIGSFSSIVVALLYLKTRQSGGESMQDLLAQFEEADKPRKKWQERVRNRLIQSGRITSKT